MNSIVTRSVSATKKGLRKIMDLPLALAVFISAVCLTNQAKAQTNLQTVTTTVTKQLPYVVDIILYGGFLVGVGLVVGGLLKLKAHSENPQTPMKAGIVMVTVGGLLCVVAFVIKMVEGTFGASSGDSSQNAANGGTSFSF